MRARVSEARGRWFDSSRSLQIFDIRGLGKRFNPLGLGPRESRFKSEVPDQVLWGSQVVRRLAVNQFMRRFESCPHSQRSEEHTSELQSPDHLVCRLLLEKKKKKQKQQTAMK